MIMQSRLLEAVEAWTPPEFITPIEDAWQAWAHCEMVKRYDSISALRLDSTVSQIVLSRASPRVCSSRFLLHAIFTGASV